MKPAALGGLCLAGPERLLRAGQTTKNDGLPHGVARHPAQMEYADLAGIWS
jgi:hypothetical protein